MFHNRQQAGRELAKRLLHHKDEKTVIVAIPRGGVVVAKEVASSLHVSLDLVIPRKIGAPENPELAIGAIVDREQVAINQNLVKSLKISEDYIQTEIKRQLNEIKRRRAHYLKGRPPLDLEGKTVIVVDDGLATGSTALAAIQAIKQSKPQTIILAIPVAPRDALYRLREAVDELVCLESPSFFYAVGQFYENFSQVSDDEVVEVLGSYQKEVEERRK